MRRQIEQAEQASAFARRVEGVLIGILIVLAIVAADGIGSELRDCRLKTQEENVNGFVS